MGVFRHCGRHFFPYWGLSLHVRDILFCYEGGGGHFSAFIAIISAGVHRWGGGVVSGGFGKYRSVNTVIKCLIINVKCVVGGGGVEKCGRVNTAVGGIINNVK